MTFKSAMTALLFQVEWTFFLLQDQSCLAYIILSFMFFCGLVGNKGWAFKEE